MSGKRKRRRNKKKNNTDEINKKVLEALEEQRKKNNSTPSENKRQVSQIPGFYYDQQRGRYFRGKQPTSIATKQPPQLQKQNPLTGFLRNRELGNFDNVIMQRQKCMEAYTRTISLDTRRNVLDGACDAIDIDASQQFVALSHFSQVTTVLKASDLSLPPQLNTCCYTSQVTAVKWQPGGINRYLAVALLGNEDASGRVRIQDYNDLQRVSTIYNKNGRNGSLWTVEWCPFIRSKISLGMSHSSFAAMIDIESNALLPCARPSVRSDVFAQTFAHSGNVILNGTRNGSVWSWDTRVPNVSCIVAQPLAHGSVCWLHIPENRPYNVLLSRTNGNVQLFDTRTNRCSVSYNGHRNTHYRTSCSLDPSESTLIGCGTDGVIRFWNVVDGTLYHELATESLGPHSVACQSANANSDAFSIWVTSRESLLHVS